MKIYRWGQHDASARGRQARQPRQPRQPEPETERDKVNRLDNLCEIHYAFVSVYLQENNLEKAWENAKETLEYAKQVERPVRLAMRIGQLAMW